MIKLLLIWAVLWVAALLIASSDGLWKLGSFMDTMVAISSVFVVLTVCLAFCAIIVGICML